MIISVNQLSLYGAAHLIKELPEDQKAPGRPVAEDPTEQEIPIQPPSGEVQANDERRGDLLQEYARRVEKIHQKTRSYPNCAPKQV